MEESKSTVKDPSTDLSITTFGLISLPPLYGLIENGFSFLGKSLPFHQVNLLSVKKEFLGLNLSYATGTSNPLPLLLFMIHSYFS